MPNGKVSFGFTIPQRGVFFGIATWRRLWSEENVSFSGKYRSFEGVTIIPRPVQQPCPIWIAANPMPNQSEIPLRRVARIADGWMTVQIFPGMLGALWPKLSRY